MPAWLASSLWPTKIVYNQARRDHIEMIEALRASRREDLIALARRHLKPSQEAYIRAYERRFGDSKQVADPREIALR